ncbi:serine/threonine-protein kinase [Pseudokineococcus basanitobsidens]|uniref:Serine/threonine-protein kinase n=1 Tax=Pseudokineococcus basanitobsidens TaxID=1926649 RepID=A0ABU8RGH3_9ACTN
MDDTTRRPSAAPSPGVGEVLGPYRLLQRVGEGGMGVVHLALGPGDRAVAVKVLRPHIADDPAARERLRREVEVLRRVRHRRVAEVLDADPDGPQPYVVTQFVPARSLEQHVAEEGPLGPAALARLADGLGRALAAVHDAGVVHRDLKPSNVLMLDGDPVVIDFGIARVADEAALTSPGLVMGTAGYLAPELLEGADVGPAADWWGWAATTAFAATGRPPFGRGPVAAVLDRVRRGRADLDGVPAELLPVLRAALSPDVDERPGEGWLRRAVEDLAAAAAREPRMAPSAGDAAATTALASLAGGRVDDEMTSVLGGATPHDTGGGTPVEDDVLDVLDGGDDATTRPHDRDGAAATTAVPAPGAGGVPAVRADGTTSWDEVAAVDALWDDGSRSAGDEEFAGDEEEEDDAPTTVHDVAPTRAVPQVAGRWEESTTTASPRDAPPAPDVHDDPWVQGRAASQHDDRGYDGRGYDGRGYDDRGYDDRGHDDRGHDDRGYDGRGHDGRGHDGRAADPWARPQDDAGPAGPLPVIGPGTPAAPRRRPDRPGLRAAWAAALVAASSLVPVVGVLVGALVVVLARTVDRSHGWVERRRELVGPRRGDVPLAVLRSPLPLLAALVTGAFSLLLPVAVAAAVVFLVGVVLGDAGVVPGDPVSLAAGAAAGVLVAWYGPGGRRLRRGAVLVTRTLPTGPAGRVLVVVALLVVAAGVWLAVTGTAPDWRPLPQAPPGL